MAAGDIHTAPYRAVVDIIGWLGERRNWHVFNGWCLAHGVFFRALDASDGLDLANYYIVEEAIFERREEKHRHKRHELNDSLIGELEFTEETPRELAPAVADVQRRTGIKPPSWFNTGGTYIGAINATGVAGRGVRGR